MTLAEMEKSRQLAIYGLMAEFDEPEALLEAARRSFTEGYRRMDAYSPFPIDGLAEAIGFHKTRLPLLVLIGGIIGCAGGSTAVLGFGDRLSVEHRRAALE